MTDAPTFFYDLGSPDCYLVAERVMSAMPVLPEWEPVLSSTLGGPDTGEPDVGALCARAAEQGLLPFRLPAGWPPDTTFAMLAATYAKHIGRAVAFSLAAFRQAFAGGRDLGLESTVLIAAAACEMHPTAILKGTALRSVSQGLERACARARAAGIVALPAISVGGVLYTGADAPERAAAA